MANTYDPPGMKAGADNIERELQKFKEAMEAVKQSMDHITQDAFNDSTGRRFVGMYCREAEPSMEQTVEAVEQYIDLLRQCARRFGNAIDNGSSYLTS